MAKRGKSRKITGGATPRRPIMSTKKSLSALKGIFGAFGNIAKDAVSAAEKVNKQRRARRAAEKLTGKGFGDYLINLKKRADRCGRIMKRTGRKTCYKRNGK